MESVDFLDPFVLVRVLVIVLGRSKARSYKPFENDDEHEQRFAEHEHEKIDSPCGRGQGEGSESSSFSD